MSAGGDELTDGQLKQAQAQKQALLKQQKLFKIEIAAMEAEMKRRAGESVSIDKRTQNRLLSLDLDLSGLSLEKVEFELVSAKNGRLVTNWTVQVTNMAADASLTVTYVTTREEGLAVVCSDVRVEEHSATLAPLVDAVGGDLQALLFGLYSLGRLSEERDQALPEVPGADRAGPLWTIPRPGGGKLNWWLELAPLAAFYQHMFSVTNNNGEEEMIPPELLDQVSSRGVSWILTQLDIL